MGMIPELEYIYSEGSDITIMNTQYLYPVFEDGKKVRDDQMIIVYKDNATGKKGYKIISKPDYTFYVLKEGEPIPNYSQLFIEREKVEPVTVPFTQLEKNIAQITGNEEFYKMNLVNKNRKANMMLHTDPMIFSSDMNIEDHYRLRFANTYTNNINKIYKGYFDIEVDGKWAKGDFVAPGECAINCVSFYDERTDKVYIFILRDERNKMIYELEKEIKSGKFGYKEIHDFIVSNVNGEKEAEKFGLNNTQYAFSFYDEEIDLIKNLFTTMHNCSPDFVLGWNSSSFDIPYIIERIIKLGYDPKDIMCDDDWTLKEIRHFVDDRHKNDLAERGDFTFISGLIVFLDQMIQYASRRKSKIGSFKSFKLDDIGLKEAKVKKLDYNHIDKSILDLTWIDFKTFVLYNIMDVIVQKCIETKTQDLEYIFSKCVVNNTAYKKGHRQTVYLVNRMAADWYKKGYIIGNNNNRDNPTPPKYLGALVGKPLNTNDYAKMKIDGRPIWVCENLQDYDYKSLYPSIMGEFNIAPNTQIGKIDIPEKVYEFENLYNVDTDEEYKYSRSGEFIENIVTDNFIEYCHRWFKLANIQEFLDDMDEYYNNLGLGQYSNLVNAGYNNNGKFVISPIKPIPMNKPISPIKFDYYRQSPVRFYNESPYKTYREVKEGVTNESRQ